MSQTFEDLLLDDQDISGFSVYDEDDYTDENDGSTVICGSGIIDGADTLEEAVELVRAYAEFLDELRINGYELDNTVEGDYGFAQLVR